jgi:hypothetical protein
MPERREERRKGRTEEGSANFTKKKGRKEGQGRKALKEREKE